MVSRCLSLSASVIGVLIKPGARNWRSRRAWRIPAPSVLIRLMMPAFDAV